MEIESIKQIPQHEKLKQELMAKFTGNTTYLGSYIKAQIQGTSFKDISPINKPSRIMVGDIILSYEGVKSRPSVILKVLKDNTCIYATLTSSDNIHCLVPFNSRFFGEGCIGKSLNICTHEFALEHYIGIFQDNNAVKTAKKELKEFFTNNL